MAQATPRGRDSVRVTPGQARPQRLPLRHRAELRQASAIGDAEKYDCRDADKVLTPNWIHDKVKVDFCKANFRVRRCGYRWQIPVCHAPALITSTADHENAAARSAPLRRMSR